MHSLVRNCAINAIEAIFQLVMSSTEVVSPQQQHGTEDKNLQTGLDLLLAYLVILDGESYIAKQFSLLCCSVKI